MSVEDGQSTSSQRQQQEYMKRRPENEGWVPEALILKMISFSVVLVMLMGLASFHAVDLRGSTGEGRKLAGKQGLCWPWE